MPFTEILPNGPASKLAGGSPDSGPVMAGCESGAGGVGAAVWLAGFGSAGTFCAMQTEASARQSANVPTNTKFRSRIDSPLVDFLDPEKRIEKRERPNMFHLSFFARFQAQKNAQKHPHRCNWTSSSSLRFLLPHSFVQQRQLCSSVRQHCQAFFAFSFSLFRFCLFRFCVGSKISS